MPVSVLWTPVVKRGLPRPLSHSEVYELRHYLEGIDLQDRTIIMTLLETGLRRAELLNLNWDHINFDDKKLWVIGKGSKKRTINIPDSTLFLLEYLRDTRYIKEGPVFLSAKTGKRLSGATLYYKLVHIGKKLGFAKLTPHILRHTYSTEYLGRTDDMKSLSEQLGHIYDYTTDVYAEFPDYIYLSLYDKYIWN